MKKRLLLIVVVCLILQTIALFIPGVFSEETWIPETEISPLGYEYKVHTYLRSTPINVWMIDDAAAVILGIAAIVVSFAAAGIACLAFLRKLPQDSPYVLVLPIASTVVLALDAIYLAGGFINDWSMWSQPSDEVWYYWGIGWLFYAIAALNVLALVFLFFVKYAKEEPVTGTEPAKHPFRRSSAQAPVATADELKKYKDLLDSGVITQEEFDAKKKELLGL